MGISFFHSFQEALDRPEPESHHLHHSRQLLTKGVGSEIYASMVVLIVNYARTTGNHSDRLSDEDSFMPLSE